MCSLDNYAHPFFRLLIGHPFDRRCAQPHSYRFHRYGILKSTMLMVTSNASAGVEFRIELEWLNENGVTTTDIKQ